MKKIVLASALFFLSTVVHAEITVDAPWVRATVPQQKFTGAFMHISSTSDVKLVSAQSPVADHLEIHEMKMDGDVMKMRQIEGVNIQAGQSIDLNPGGYHIMFMGLKQQMKEGDLVPISLVFESKGHASETVRIKAIVKPLNATAGKGMSMH